MHVITAHSQADASQLFRELGAGPADLCIWLKQFTEVGCATHAPLFDADTTRCRSATGRSRLKPMLAPTSVPSGSGEYRSSMRYLITIYARPTVLRLQNRLK